MSATWRVELHSHTIWSKDCLVKFETIRQICAQRTIDRIAITDHNTAEGALRMRELAPELIIVGEEIMTSRGELLGYFMSETVPPGLSPEETINRLRSQGAVISVSHPFDGMRKGAWEEADLLRILDQIDAIETFNARCIAPAYNQRAAEFARSHRLLATVGSDAHSEVEYGRALMEMTPFDSANAFRASLQTARPLARYSSPLVHFSSTWAKQAKKLGFAERLWEGG